MELGVASAATQIEGGDKNNSWYDWYQKGHITDGSDPSIADRHYELYEADTRLMHSMGIRHYRLGVEWARLEPEPGVYDEAAFAHYRAELALLRQLGIKPLLTLHHFTNPMWFERMGAFESPGLRRYVPALRHKGDQRVGATSQRKYITINEPNVYAVFGWFFGDWPPGKKSIRATFRTYNHLCECHVKAYGLIHKLRAEMGLTDTKVSYAHHMRVFEAKNPHNLWQRVCARLMRRLFQTSFSPSVSDRQGVLAVPTCAPKGPGVLLRLSPRSTITAGPP